VRRSLARLQHAMKTKISHKIIIENAKYGHVLRTSREYIFNITDNDHKQTEHEKASQEMIISKLNVRRHHKK